MMNFPALSKRALTLLLWAPLLAACSSTELDRTDTGGMAAAVGACQPEAIAATAPSGLRQARLCISDGQEAHAFVVEVAESPDEQAHGLMFRETLDAGRGMIFPFDPPRPASFWMKNTLIPLDMVFIAPDGRIESIISDVEPQTLTPRRSQGAVRAVLELAGGQADALGIEAGDRVSWPR